MIELLKHSSQADRSLIAALYQSHAPSILTFIRRHIPSREDAEDILLEVFLAALESEKLGAFNEGEQLAWLRRVAYNKCIDHYRRQNRTSIVSLEQAMETLFTDEQQAPEQISLRNEAHARLHMSLAALPEAKQHILRLRFAQNLSSPEIARLLNSNEGAIRTMLSRTLNLLRGLYENSDEEHHYG
jgi:RNA polymerase sigma-70 factor (ECF subfamily)